MEYGSVCSGIEAATVAWHPLGWRAKFFSEIEQFPNAVLRHHYPSVPNYGDMTKFQEWPDANLNVLVGGTPCQAFSVAGLRKGLDDPRGNLTLTYLAIANRYRPLWLVWENVPGVLSIDDGRTFASFLSGLGQCGYGFAYRVLDAQYFGLAQRRKRVFVVGYLGDWRRAAAVLFERASLSGYPPPCREARQDIAGTIGSNTKGGFRSTDLDLDQNGAFITDVAWALQERDAKGQDSSTKEGRLIPVAFEPRIARDRGYSSTETVGTLTKEADRGDGHPCVAIPIQEVGKRTGTSATDPRAGIGIGNEGDPMFTLQAGAQHGLSTMSGVRRLTPREFERLQGFPDDYTLIPFKGKPATDTHRYKALGNSMAVPVMRWIGERIATVDAIA